MAKPKTPDAASASRWQPLRVLLVEDSPTDALLLTRALQRGGFTVASERVDTPESFTALLDRQEWDLILCDHSMPCFSAPEALALLKGRGLDIPFIIVSGYIEEETAVEAMKAGAHDYIMKDRLARLVPAVMRELQDAEARRARDRYEDQLRVAREELELRVEQRTADLKAANLRLNNVLAERRKLEDELLEIAENERRRIGFDLHDDLGQKLTGVSLLLKALEHRLTATGHPSAEDARKVVRLLDGAIQHAHDLARQFASLDVKGDNLSEVFRGLAANVRRMFEIPCGLTLKGALPDVTAKATLQLYKIAQEAVSNAIKHGKASRVAISLCRENGMLTLVIKNNGISFSPPANDKNRMGLRIMKYRAGTIGATLNVKAGGKSGAVVTCVFPIHDSAADEYNQRQQGTTPRSGSLQPAPQEGC